MRSRCLNLESWQSRAALDGRLRALLVPVREQPRLVNGWWYWDGDPAGYTDEAMRLTLQTNAPIRPGDAIVGREAWYVGSWGRIFYAIDGMYSGHHYEGHTHHFSDRSPTIMKQLHARHHFTCTSVRAVRTTESDLPLDDLGLWCYNKELLCEGAGLTERLLAWWNRKHGRRYGLWSTGPWCYLYGLEPDQNTSKRA